jgi:hypothetical protein
VGHHFSLQLVQKVTGASAVAKGARDCVSSFGGGIYHNDEMNEMGVSESNA